MSERVFEFDVSNTYVMSDFIQARMGDFYVVEMMTSADGIILNCLSIRK